ncbi:MAG: hypothetical protein QM231_03500 [Chloroflexota bacterium]|jgi:hypothetical protein|nr:hypothetical protein [Chloroflexota bacterium]
MNIVFGFIGEQASNRFLRLAEAYERLFSTDQHLNNVISPDNHAAFAISQPGGFFPISGPVLDINENLLLMLNGYFWYHDHFPLTIKEAANQLVQAGKEIRRTNQLEMTETDGGVFNLFLYDILKKKLTIVGDYSGLMPLYFYKSNQGFFFSSHIRILSYVLSPAIDRVGVIERVSYHYTIGRRTVFKDVFQKNVGETVIYELENNTTSFIQPTAYYSRQRFYKNDMEAVEELHHAYISGIKELTRPSLIHGVLLSGGFDTRLVIYGLQKTGASIQSLTFGDPNNFEVRIAGKIARMVNSEHEVYTPIMDCDLTDSRILNLMRLVETVSFPYCESGASLLKKSGSQTISTGFAGETLLGGQGYNLLGSSFSSQNRLIYVLKRMIGCHSSSMSKMTRKTFEDGFLLTDSFHRRLFDRSARFFSDSFLDGHDQEIYSEIRNDIRGELIRYASLNDSLLMFLLERFWYEHHVSKEFGGQERTVGSILPLLTPTVHHSFLSLCTNLPVDRKIDHGIYLRFIKHYFGNLAKIPTSNIPVPINLPDIILWTSRAIRAYIDQKLVKRQISLKSFETRRKGWSNFESWFRRTDFLDKAALFVDYDVFSEKYLTRQIEKWKNWESRIYSGQELLTFITLSKLIK